MKNVLIIAFLLISILFSLSGFAQDYMKWGLPEHAILRLGKGQIYDLKHSPNGNLIAVATSIGVWLYDAHSGKESRLLQKHGYEVHSVAFSPNGKMLASSGSDSIHLWDPYTGQHLSTLKDNARSGIKDLVFFFPDGRTLVSTRGKIIRFWDVVNKTVSKTLTGHTQEILSLAISPNGKTVVSGSSIIGDEPQSNALRWWDVETGRMLFFSTAMDSAVTALVFSPNGKILACANSLSDSPNIYLFDGVSGEILRTLPELHGKTISLEFSLDGKTLASTGWDGTIRLWDPHTGHHIHTFRGYVGWLSFSPDSKTLVSGGDGAIRFWDTSTKKQRFSVSGHWNSIGALTFSSDSQTLISGGSETAIIHKWHLSTGQLTSTLTLSSDREQILAFNTKRGLFASINGDQSPYKIHIRDIDTGQLHASTDYQFLLPLISGTSPLAFSQDGETIIVLNEQEIGRKKVLEFWDSWLHSVNFKFVPHKNEIFKYSNTDVTALASSPDNTLLATAVGGRVVLWKFGTDELILSYPEFGRLSCHALAFSNDNKILAIGDSLNIRLIEVDTGNLITTVSKHNNWVKALTFSDDGKIFASGSQDGTILVWDLHKIMRSQ
ncbi:WD40 repeat domain-containing protein [Candidatus Poribacteria bacterium]|nr:WD40 repeat domain-containing protein [Candidatus Poribacteria bacterium]MYK21498.1 WD40 repeat domain-containing protein [Candidatus Poribacteria bacterium]